MEPDKQIPAADLSDRFEAPLGLTGRIAFLMTRRAGRQMRQDGFIFRDANSPSRPIAAGNSRGCCSGLNEDRRSLIGKNNPAPYPLAAIQRGASHFVASTGVAGWQTRTTAFEQMRALLAERRRCCWSAWR